MDDSIEPIHHEIKCGLRRLPKYISNFVTKAQVRTMTIFHKSNTKIAFHSSFWHLNIKLHKYGYKQQQRQKPVFAKVLLNN